MKASELRIGNYIENTDAQMASYMVVNADVIKQNEHTMYASLEPIQLTEEWLIKFGFEKTPWYFNSYRLVIGNNDYAILIDLDGDCEVGDIITCKIEYIHQLQNLYFALTGKELKLKP